MSDLKEMATFCTTLAMRISDGVSVDSVDARTLIDVADALDERHAIEATLRAAFMAGYKSRIIYGPGSDVRAEMAAESYAKGSD